MNSKQTIQAIHDDDLKEWSYYLIPAGELHGHRIGREKFLVLRQCGAREGQPLYVTEGEQVCG
jgi:hypothetical protein